jgi:hypothetical protein
MDNQGTVKVHPFSRTLGPGPYRFIGQGKVCFGETFGARYIGPACESGAGTCAHCGTAIIYVYVIETAEKRRFGVGSDCIGKIQDQSQFENFTAFERELKLQKRKAGQETRERSRIKLMQQCQDRVASNFETLSKHPHPSPFRANETFQDYAKWYVARTGASLGAWKEFRIKLDAILGVEPKLGVSK